MTMFGYSLNPPPAYNTTYFYYYQCCSEKRFTDITEVSGLARNFSIGQDELINENMLQTRVMKQQST